MKRVAIGLTMALAACGAGATPNAAMSPCDSTPSPVASPSLPSLPALDDVRFTTTTTAGPTTIVEGYSSADLQTVYDRMNAAFSQGGYSVTKNEKDAHDAEVNFSGNGTTGSVKLVDECLGRVSVSIKIRPAA
jgi:ABC-type phosphate transport system substrate-binding protein